ncbi:MAG: TPM domain-containing protein [Thermomicrobiales bacterium]
MTSGSRFSTGQKASFVAALLIPLLVLGFFVVTWLVPHEGEDTLSGVKLAQPGIATSPNGLISAADANSLASMTNDGSLFGMPMAVRIVRVAEPMTQPETIEAAENYYKTTPIETESGAQNGLLFYIAVPQNNPKAATAAFVPGTNFFPQNGLTQQRLDRTLSDIVQPRLAEGNYADAAKQGAAWVVYDQLFGTYPRVPLSHGQQVLNHLTNRALAPLVGLLAAGYIGLAVWTRRTARANRDLPATAVSSPYVAGAIARGRADDALPTAAMLTLFAQGNLRIATNRRAIEIGPEPETDDPFACAIWERASELAEHAGGTIPLSAISRLDDAFAPQLAYVRTRLVRDGQFSGRIPGLNRLMWGIGAAILLLIGYLLIPSLVSRAAAGFLTAIGATAVLLGVTWWTFHRRRSTSAGILEANAWLASQRTAAQAGDTEAIANLRTYRLIVRQEDLIADRTIVAEDYGNQAPRFIALVRGMSIA